MMIFHNSFDKTYRNPLGAVTVNTSISFFIKSDENYDSVIFRLWTEEENEKQYIMDKAKDGYIITLSFEYTSTYWYYFILKKGNKSTFYCCCDGYTGGEGLVLTKPCNSFQITVYNKEYETPEWFKKSIMYQIFPDRFCRQEPMESYTGTRNIHYNWFEKPNYLDTGASNYDFFGGNFRGVESKLHYLKELSVNVIYFNPVFESSSNHRYDTADYMKTDSLLGDEDDFKKLTKSAEKLGINIILDGVFNHTGSDSRYFNKYGKYDEVGAYQSKNSKYYSWYSFIDYPKRYDSWWGIETLPNVNENDKSFNDFIYKSNNSVMNKWMSIGVKGFRLDVADELTNEFLEGFYKKAKSIDSQAVVIGEVWEDATNKVSYGNMRKYAQGKQLDSVMNYPIRNLIIDFLIGGYYEEGTNHNHINAHELSLKLMNLYYNYPKCMFYSLMNFLSTHDTHRIMTIFSEAPSERNMTKKEQSKYVLSEQQYELAVKRLKLAWAFIISLPGVPCIYYGDEIGMYGYKDPFNRCTYPWGKGDNELLEFFKNMNRLRKENQALYDGNLEVLYTKEDIIAIERTCDRQKVVFIMNRSRSKSGTINITTKQCYENIENREIICSNGNKITVNISPLSYKFLIEKIS